MTIPLRLGSQAAAQSAFGTVFHPYLPGRTETPESKSRPEPSTAELAFRILAVLRTHPHINNVLTHISRARWGELEQSLHRILDLSTTSNGLSPLEENIIELMTGERGITGRILKPYFQAVLHRMLEPSHAERLIRHIAALYLELEWKVQHPPALPRRNEPAEEPCHVGSEAR